MFHWSVNELLDFCKCHNFIELAANFGPSHAENRAIKIDVLSTGKFAVESFPDLEQARDSTANFDPTSCRLRYAAQYL